MSPDVFFVVFRPWIGLALGGIRALRRIAVGIPAFVGEFERPRSVWRPSAREVREIRSAAGLHRRRGVGVVHAVVYVLQVWLRARGGRVVLRERKKNHHDTDGFCDVLWLMVGGWSPGRWKQRGRKSCLSWGRRKPQESLGPLREGGRRNSRGWRNAAAKGGRCRSRCCLRFLCLVPRAGLPCCDAREDPNPSFLCFILRFVGVDDVSCVSLLKPEK